MQVQAIVRLNNGLKEEEKKKDKPIRAIANILELPKSTIWSVLKNWPVLKGHR